LHNLAFAIKVAIVHVTYTYNDKILFLAMIQHCMASRDSTLFLKWQRRSFRNLTWNCWLQSIKNLLLWF